MATTARTQIAAHAYLKAYGVLDPTDRDKQEGWGLKTSPTDAVYEMAKALYPRAEISIVDITDEVAEATWELEQDGLEAEQIADAIVPMIDDMMAGALLGDAADLGLDVEAERCDWYFVAEMIQDIHALPEAERASAVRAANDGAHIDDRANYAV